MNEPAPAAVGKLCNRAHLFAQIVGMWVNAQNLHRHRQDKTVLDPIFLLSWGNVDGPGAQSDDEGGPGRGLVTEIQPHAGLNQFRFAGGHHVQFKHQVGPSFQLPSPPFGAFRWNLAWCPTQEMAVGSASELAGPHAFETGDGIFFIQLPAAKGRVDQSYRMMDDPWVSGPQFQGSHETV